MGYRPRSAGRALAQVSTPLRQPHHPPHRLPLYGVLSELRGSHPLPRNRPHPGVHPARPDRLPLHGVLSELRGSHPLPRNRPPLRQPHHPANRHPLYGVLSELHKPDDPHRDDFPWADSAWRFVAASVQPRPLGGQHHEISARRGASIAAPMRAAARASLRVSDAGLARATNRARPTACRSPSTGPAEAEQAAPTRRALSTTGTRPSRPLYGVAAHLSKSASQSRGLTRQPSPARHRPCPRLEPTARNVRHIPPPPPRLVPNLRRAPAGSPDSEVAARQTIVWGCCRFYRNVSPGHLSPPGSAA